MYRIIFLKAGNNMITVLIVKVKVFRLNIYKHEIKYHCAFSTRSEKTRNKLL